MPPHPRRRRILVFVTSALLGACGAASTPLPAMKNDPASSADAGLQAVVRQVRDDAQRRSGVDASGVTVARSARVTWPDGSLGCPAPGRMYTQALVPGYRIEIDAGGQRHDYHASASGQWLLCPADRAVEPRPDLRK